MKSTKFKDANKILLKPEGMIDEECSELTIWTDGKECVSCWQMSWKEKIFALIYGRVWLYVLSGSTQPSVALTCKRNVFIREENNEDDK